MLGRHATPFSSENLNATEFSDLYLEGIDSRTLVIATSHSGGTKETVLAAEAASERGALVVSLAKDTNNPLARAANFQLAYGSERTITSAKYAILSELGYSLLESVEAPVDIAGARSALDAMPAATLDAVESMELKLQRIAQRFADSENIYVIAGGPLIGLAYMLSVCYLVEMQWMKSTHFMAADFFHGPFEMAQNGQPYILLTGEDATRGHIDRVKKFLDQYNDNYALIDTADLTLPGVAHEFRGAVGHIPMASLVMRLAEQFEPITGHDLDLRKYMGKVAY
jgi:fructoselysine-6-P-deglycase FrlB-like protein